MKLIKCNDLKILQTIKLNNAGDCGNESKTT